jgi:hypothetical protein
MEIPSTRGQDGTPIPVFGMAARTCPLGWVLESATSEGLDGAGITGDSIGVADSQLLAAAGTTPGATRFITGAASTEAEGRAVELTTVAASTEVERRAAELTTVPAQRPERSMETGRRREDTLHPAVRAASAQAPSAASKRAGRQRAIRHAEAPASVAEDRVAEGDFTAEEEEGAGAVGVGNRSFVRFQV